MILFEHAHELFSSDAVHPETERNNRELERELASLPLLREQTPEQARAQIHAQLPQVEPPAGGVARDVVIPGPGGELRLRVLHPGGDLRGVYLHMHGGGFVVGSPEDNEALTWGAAEHGRVAVVSVDYRLAPEHPYPAAVDDCEAAARWLIEHARELFGCERLLIGGESCGANLATVTLLRLRGQAGLGVFHGANLVYGWFDLGHTPSARRWGAEPEILISTPTLEWMASHYVPRERRAQPEVSPLYADLRGLPPALVSCGTADPILDDSLFMAARWMAAGNEVALEVYPGGVHGFNLFPGRLQRDFNARFSRFVNDVAFR